MPLAVAAAILVLAVYTQITLTFEGRLWTLPARVYSARLHLVPGQMVDANAFVARLDRCGYARVDTTPSQPGQYRRRLLVVDLFVRGFAGGERPVAARHVVLSFDRESIVSIGDERGRPLTSLDLEPELLSLVFGRQQEERMIVPLAEAPRDLVNAVLPPWTIRPLFTLVNAARNTASGSMPACR